MASCSDSQVAWFIAGGLVSFSQSFFDGVLLGFDLDQCFDQAASAMAKYQTAWLDDNNDGYMSLRSTVQMPRCDRRSRSCRGQGYAEYRTGVQRSGADRANRRDALGG